MSHDPSEIILLFWFGALKNMFLLYILKTAVVCSIIFSWNPSHFFRVLWWICSKEHIWEHLFEIETFCNKVAQELSLSTLVMKVKCSDSHMYLFLNLPSDFMIHWLWQQPPERNAMLSVIEHIVTCVMLGLLLWALLYFCHLACFVHLCSRSAEQVGSGNLF